MDEINGWPAPRDYALSRNEVHVWRVPLDWSPARLRKFRAVLSADEQEKADRFHFALDRMRHLVGRGVLRTILARCTKVSAERLCFEYSPSGKPHLANGSKDAPLQFNVSHSGELILIALTIGRAVGVDVERLRTDIEAERIAASFFSPHERLALRSVPAHLRVDAFFDCWTRKEAYIKAAGHGLSLPLDQFDVSFAPGQEPALLATRPDADEARRWSIQAVNVGPDYRGAVAVEGAGWQLKTWDWPVNAID
jgi:4'-phosphopantetheinyl transferase